MLSKTRMSQSTESVKNPHAPRAHHRVLGLISFEKITAAVRTPVATVSNCLVPLAAKSNPFERQSVVPAGDVPRDGSRGGGGGWAGGGAGVVTEVDI